MANWPLSGPLAYKAFLPSALINAIDTFLTKVPNFSDGSEHVASSPVILHGEFDIVDGKLRVSGDANTDAVAIVAGSGNSTGLSVTGGGTSPGISSTGGATGNGGEFLAGGGNAKGVTCVGSGTGAGATCTGGATGPGLTTVNGTAQTDVAPTCAAQFAGYAQFTGTDPTATTNPGANNALHGLAITKAWFTVLLFGSGPYTPDDAYNIASLVLSAPNTVTVTFVRPMANAFYIALPSVEDEGFAANVVAGSKTVNGFDFRVFDTTTGVVGGSGKTVGFLVCARQ